MTSDQELALAEYERCVRELQPGLAFQQGGKKWEGRYLAAYHRMVTLGLAPRLRGKYR